MEIVGTRGFKGKKAKNARTQFKALFSFEEPEVDTESDDSVQLDVSALDQLEQEQQWTEKATTTLGSLPEPK